MYIIVCDQVYVYHSKYMYVIHILEPYLWCSSMCSMYYTSKYMYIHILEHMYDIHILTCIIHRLAYAWALFVMLKYMFEYMYDIHILTCIIVYIQVYVWYKSTYWYNTGASQIYVWCSSICICDAPGYVQVYVWYTYTYLYNMYDIHMLTCIIHRLSYITLKYMYDTWYMIYKIPEVMQAYPILYMMYVPYLYMMYTCKYMYDTWYMIYKIPPSSQANIPCRYIYLACIHHT